MEMVLFEKGISAFRAFFKRPQKHRHIVLCYIGLYTILQLQVVSARHHDLGKLLAVSNNNNNNNDNDNNFNENELNSLHQQQESPQSNNYAQINHSIESGDPQKQHQQEQQQQTILKQPILGQKITQQTPGSDIGPSGAVLSKDDGKYFSSFSCLFQKAFFVSICTKIQTSIFQFFCLLSN